MANIEMLISAKTTAMKATAALGWPYLTNGGKSPTKDMHEEFFT